MIKYFFILISLLTCYQLITSCANVSPPSGGPRDTIPPIRITTIPENKITNYKGKTINMEFDERVRTNNIKDQLIITPLIEFDYEYILKKNNIKLIFEESFQDSTTYTLNFRESIQDITEGNPTRDNKFTFSTGSFIDSMSISGYIKDLLTYDTLENIVVGLYRAEDTVTIFNGSPYYFTEIEDDGSYFIENIKNGSYLLYAFLDANKNLKLETNTEAYAFAKDTIQLDTGLFKKNIDLIRQDLTDLRILTSLASGKYYDINFNKHIIEYSIHPINNDHQLFTNLAKETKTIRCYNNFSDIDSLQVAFTAYDSIQNQISDTVFVKFNKSQRKKDEFTIQISPENNTSIEPLLYININFSKPILTLNTDSIFIQYDTTKIMDIHDSLFVWNDKKDKLSILIEIDKSKADTILHHRIKLDKIKKDSLETIQKDTQIKKQVSKNKKDDSPKINKGLQLYFGTNSFLSADQDSSKSFGYNYKFIVPEEYGIQSINILTSYENFMFQLLSERFELIREIKNQKTITMKNLKPGNYKIRVLIDENNDGIWSPGNMIKRIEPEPVYIHPEKIIIRADWQTSLNLTF